MRTEARCDTWSSTTSSTEKRPGGRVKLRVNTAFPCLRAPRLFSGTSTGESWPKCSLTTPLASRTRASTEKCARRVPPLPSKASPSSGISATSV